MANSNIGALWMKKSKEKGTKYMSGVIDLLGEDINIVVFANDKKKNDKEPDFRIVRSKDREEKKASSGADPFMDLEGEVPAGGVEAIDLPDEDIKAEDLPFGN